MEKIMQKNTICFVDYLLFTDMFFCFVFLWVFGYYLMTLSRGFICSFYHQIFRNIFFSSFIFSLLYDLKSLMFNNKFFFLQEHG